jgi:hypothetical protein
VLIFSLRLFSITEWLAFRFESRICLVVELPPEVFLPLAVEAEVETEREEGVGAREEEVVLMEVVNRGGGRCEGGRERTGGELEGR